MQKLRPVRLRAVRLRYSSECCISRRRSATAVLTADSESPLDPLHEKSAVGLSCALDRRCTRGEAAGVARPPIPLRATLQAGTHRR